MSPSIALHDPIFRTYLIIVPAVLVFGGLVLALIKKNIGPVWKTYRSWWGMSALAFVFVFAGRVPAIIGVMLLSILAMREFARASALDRERWTMCVLYVGIVAVALASFVRQDRFFMATLVFTIAAIWLIPILRNRARGELPRMSLGIIGFLCLGWLFGHLGLLANSANAYGFICYIVFATELSDVAAFTFGKIFGRHPLRSEISPNKTWEGALGALAAALALPWLLRFSFPFFGATELILIGLIVGVGGQLGDLSISLLKRELGIKNMGEMIPGHGGVLDRIDSLIFVAPAFFYLTRL